MTQEVAMNDAEQWPPIDGRRAFARAVRLALECAAENRVRELCFCDPDFVDWPLSDAGVLQALTRWARPKRQLLIVAHHYEDLPLKHPRFVAWRRTWAHLIHCRAAPELSPGELPSLLLGSPRASLQRLETVRSQGRWLTDEDDWRTWREVVDAVLQRSEEAFPAHTLGL
jgi:hypothetical protein